METSYKTHAVQLITHNEMRTFSSLLPTPQLPSGNPIKIYAASAFAFSEQLTKMKATKN